MTKTSPAGSVMNTDRYGRTIDYLRISVTDRCNFRCLYCMPCDGVPFFPHSEILTYEEIIRLAGIFAEIGVKKVRLTGGEPLVRRNISYLVRNVAAIPGIQETSLTTNGLLLSPMLDELLAAGLKRVNISLDTLRTERFKQITGTDGLAEVMRAVDRCIEKHVPLKINMVVIKGVNDDEITDFVLLAKERDIQVRFIEFMPWGTTDFWSMDKVVKIDEMLSLISGAFGTLKPAEKSRSGPAAIYALKGFSGSLGFITPMSEHFCAGCNRIRLTADGKLRLCLFCDSEVDIRQYLRAGIDDAGLKDVLTRALFSKPERIDLQKHITAHDREMNQIGG